MNRKAIVIGSVLVLSALLIGGCGRSLGGQLPEEEPPGLANPASVYCQDQGHTLEMRTDGNNTYGVCIFADGSECEEWAYFRGECQPGSEQGVESPAEEAPPAEAPTVEAPPEDATAQPASAPEPAPAACVDDSEFVADLTVPDGTVLVPGASFVKAWRLRNSGTCTWTTQYQFYDIYSGSPGTRISAPQSINIPREVAPGETIDLSVDMNAPGEAGEYTSQWRMANPGGGPFGSQPYVSIVVREATGGCVEDSDFVTDVTVPDGTVFSPGETFTKTWRLKNSGTCTWTTGYQFYDIYSGSPGTRISAPDSINIPRQVAPGETVDLSVDMTAPGEAGEYTSQWRLANPGGGAFGTQPFVKIVVSGESEEGCVDDSEFVEDVTVPDGTEFSPGETFTKTWRLRNDGTCTWTTAYMFYDIYSGVPETRISAPESINIPHEVAPGKTIDLAVEMTAPDEPGEYTSQWRMANPGGGAFGSQPYVKIVVTE